MIRKVLLIALAIVFLAGLSTSPALAAKSYFAEQYDVHVAVQTDGSLLVTETIHFRFEGGPFSYVFRELSDANLDHLEVVEATLDGQPLPQGTGAGQVEIEPGRPLTVTWHFPELSDSTHVFGLTYRVLGAVRHDAAADTIIWRAIPEEHEYSIQESSITFEWPGGVLPVRSPELSRTGAQLDTIPGQAVFSLSNIEEDEAIDATLVFPSGSLVGVPPAWQSAEADRAARNQAALPYGLGAAGLVGLLGLGAILAASKSFQRDEAGAAPTGQVYSSPPGQVAPALAAKLTGASMPFLGTLFDLARRGHLRIEEGEKSWGSRSFRVVRQNSTDRLSAHEQAFLEALYKNDSSGSVNLNKIGGLASNTQYNSAVEDELKQLGWRDAERSRRRAWFLGLTVIGLLFGALLLIAGLIWLDQPPAAQFVLAAAPLILTGAGLALIAVSFAGLFVAALVSTLTSSGTRQAAAWKSFSTYLRDITRGRETPASPDLFDRYLPYAAAFGHATGWSKTFQNQSGVPTPAWFYGLHGGMDDGSWIAIMAAISSADSSASSAASGAGGASGGGASGAG